MKNSTTGNTLGGGGGGKYDLNKNQITLKLKIIFVGLFCYFFSTLSYKLCWKSERIMMGGGDGEYDLA